MTNGVTDTTVVFGPSWCFSHGEPMPCASCAKPAAEPEHVPVDQLNGKTIKKASEGPRFGAIRLEFTDGTNIDIGAYTTGDDVWICEAK